MDNYKLNIGDEFIIGEELIDHLSGYDYQPTLQPGMVGRIISYNANVIGMGPVFGVSIDDERFKGTHDLSERDDFGRRLRGWYMLEDHIVDHALWPGDADLDDVRISEEDL